MLAAGMGSAAWALSGIVRVFRSADAAVFLFWLRFPRLDFRCCYNSVWFDAMAFCPRPVVLWGFPWAGPGRCGMVRCLFRKVNTMANSYLPQREGDLVNWGLNIVNRFAPDPTVFGLTLDQAAAFTDAQAAFSAAYLAATEPATRGPSKIETKNTTKKAFIAVARDTVGIIQAFPGTTDTMRVDLGITVRDYEPTPVPVPTESPVIDVTGVSGLTIKLRLHNGDSTRRAKPDGVKGATLFSYVGEEPPVDLADWKFEGSVTKTVTSVTMASTVPPGSKVWLTSFWFNTRAESGPATSPVFTWTGNGGVNMAA